MTEQSQVEVSDTFEMQIRSLIASNKANAGASRDGTQPSWMLPDAEGGEEDWEGDLFSLEKLSVPFSREAIAEDFRRTVENPDNPGVSGDLVAATLQSDYLGAMERAFRARHTMRRPRAMAHAAGRMHGHGSDRGTLAQTALEFVRGIVKEAKSS